MYLKYLEWISNPLPQTWAKNKTKTINVLAIIIEAGQTGVFDNAIVIKQVIEASLSCRGIPVYDDGDEDDDDIQN